MQLGSVSPLPDYYDVTGLAYGAWIFDRQCGGGLGHQLTSLGHLSGNRLGGVCGACSTVRARSGKVSVIIRRRGGLRAVSVAGGACKRNGNGECSYLGRIRTPGNLAANPLPS